MLLNLHIGDYNRFWHKQFDTITIETNAKKELAKQIYNETDDTFNLSGMLKDYGETEVSQEFIDKCSEYDLDVTELIDFFTIEKDQTAKYFIESPKTFGYIIIELMNIIGKKYNVQFENHVIPSLNDSMIGYGLYED